LEYGAATTFAPSAIDESTSESIDENAFNRIRKRQHAEKFIPLLVAAIRDEPFEPGSFSSADYLVREMLSKNSLVAKELLQELFRDSLSKSRFEIASGVMEVVGRLDEESITPAGEFMAITALKCRNIRLQEAGIRAFENWGSPRAASILAQIEFASDWLGEYAQYIIQSVAKST